MFVLQSPNLQVGKLRDREDIMNPSLIMNKLGSLEALLSHSAPYFSYLLCRN